MDDAVHLSADSPRSEAPHRVLVVDDEEFVLNGLREALRHEGYIVFAHLDPLAALETLAREELSVIIADQRMPHLSGLELLDRVREQQPDASRILITAVLSLDTVIAAINRGEIYRFIVKPWLREELLATVRNAAQRFDLICRNRALQEETRLINARLLQTNHTLEQQIHRAKAQNQQLATANESLNQDRERLLRLCVRSLETFSPALGIQTRRVCQICKLLAGTFNLSDAESRVLETAAWLHDLGLLSAPRNLIRLWQENPAQLKDHEWSVIRQHPVLGQELVGDIESFVAAGEIIRGHHERFDGGGYPDRLSGEAIPWLARVLAVAVAFASKPGPASAALAAIREGSGRSFDPRAVRAFLNVVPRLATIRMEQNVELSHLKPGMILARDVYTTAGALVLAGGSEIGRQQIETLQDSTENAGLPRTLMVYC